MDSPIEDEYRGAVECLALYKAQAGQAQGIANLLARHAGDAGKEAHRLAVLVASYSDKVRRLAIQRTAADIGERLDVVQNDFRRA